MSSQRFGVAKLCRIGGRVSLLSPFLGLGERRKGRGHGEGVQRSRQHGLVSGAGQKPEERQLKGRHQPRRGAQAGRPTTVRLVLLAAGEETES